MQLQRGEKRGLSELGLGPRCTVTVDFGLHGVDIAAFGLTAARTIGDDRYVVLFSNTSSPEGAIQLAASSGTATFTLDLERLPATIDRIVFTATHDTRPISEARPLIVTLGAGTAVFNVAEHLTTEKAVMMIEIYRHTSGWKVGAIAAGFAGGLASLITHFGGEVGDKPAAPTSGVSLKKITLEKSNPTVSLKKVGTSFGEIRLNLNWNQSGQKTGFFGGSKKVDLDLGVLYELDDGSRGAIQALGNSFGAYESKPWIELSGDDRTGAAADGETIRVNGRFFDHVTRLAVFALIYDGAPNWQQTDGIVRMNIPGQPEIEVHMNEGRNDRRLCGIAVIENVGGELRIKRHMQYYRDQKDFAETVGIKLRWTVGTKD
jgi:tellurite resistance protein TerA